LEADADRGTGRQGVLIQVQKAIESRRLKQAEAATLLRVTQIEES